MAPGSDKILVLVQLLGGNDGLQAVIPLDKYDNLVKARPNIILPQNKVLKVKDELGLHPGMTGLRSLYDDGRLGIVHSVGYPNQNRSHFRSTDIWSSGSPANVFWNTGWLGRYFETQAPGFPEGYPNAQNPDPFAITLSSTVSETCQGTISNYSLTLSDPFALVQLAEGSGGQTPDTPYGHELAFLRTAILQTNDYADSITAAAKKGKNLATYPANNALATQLKNIALLISGGLKTNVYIARLGGFDTHANQVDVLDTTRGVHANLLTGLSDAIAAFQNDLKLMKQEERVIGLTFSEFGRQIKSNNSAGTDHGTAAPLFVFGSCVKTPVLGKNPDIPDQLQPQEGVAMQFDFRDIYGSILMDWFGVAESAVKTLLHPNFVRLPIVKPCELATPTDDIVSGAIEAYNYPNPFFDQTTIAFDSPGGLLRISLYDALGSELMVLANEPFPAGPQEFTFNGHQLAAGNYYIRIQSSKARQTTLRMVKTGR